ncbi:DUF2786 domain-containing protein [Streptomyces sp. DSM 41982]|uniref:DUF2786 domain-containing protein n=1 Tax=Streptomyces evansiae TaxID=3075535 RepID=A0ABD5EE21_9ACTN|nr:MULTISPECIES: DUF2786 domain-containing protein [unclassified Streptomyces]MDT0418888.1 DUF2786 domain-containing protein [Streptomyces sp. DSM 41982]SCE04977.1 Protein of unknown function [Streptomyces sp. SolWspMP-sol7th]
MAENAKLTRVRALLATAEDAATTPEAAESYRARAFALMAKYGIEEAALSVDGPGDVMTDRTFTISAPWTLEQASLLNRVALASQCSAINLGCVEGSPSRLVRVFGASGDLERVEILYSSLRVQMLRELGLAQVPWHVQPGGPTRAWRRSFLVAGDGGDPDRGGAQYGAGAVEPQRKGGAVDARGVPGAAHGQAEVERDGRC